MIGFDLDRFLKEKKLGAKELAQKMNCSLPAVYFVKKRGTVKPSFLRKLESIFGDCGQYLKTERAQAV